MATWAYIYEHPGADPIADRFELARGGQRSLMVPVPDAASAPDVARRLVDHDGVELIEMCGGFTLADAAAVVEAVGERVGVGHVAFAVQSIPATASYAEHAAADAKVEA